MLNRFSVITIGLLVSFSAFADPLEVILSSEIFSAKDNKTHENHVLKGHKVRVRSRVSIHVRGFTSGSLREWLQSRLPKRLTGYFEREDTKKGLVTRFKPVTFKLKPDSLHCYNDDHSPEFRVCQANYAVSRSNTVDVSAGEGGEQKISLQMLAPKEMRFPVKIARSATRSYTVLNGTPKLSLNKFAGLPQH